MRHLIDPADFTLEETLSLMDLADRIMMTRLPIKM